MHKITPHLWFDKEAQEAAEFYISAFPNSKVNNVNTLHDTPSGDAAVVSFQLAGQPFMAISAGPLFKFTPAVSFLVACTTKEEVDKLWQKLSEGGKALMELGEYPFSARYGWTEDRYDLSWQVMLAGPEQEIKQKITPVLMFTEGVYGKAEEAINFYVSVFRDAKAGDMVRYEKGEEPDREGTVKFGAFTLEGQDFAAMDSARVHGFTFNEAISFMVNCRDQEEIDYYWSRLSAVPESEQCGWLKDKYGVSWQIVPQDMDKMMNKGSKEQIRRVTQSFLKMKKFDLAKLQKAYEGGD